MAQIGQTSERRTNVDDVFDYLHKEILSLSLLPGDKISEADLASKFGVSRQPVRDAFSRLANLNLLLIRPQRATEVKRFSSREIEKSRFVRSSIEKEVLIRAAKNCNEKDAAALDKAIVAQERLILEENFDKFGALDYAFHKKLCAIAKVDYAFEVIAEEKAKLDRLCMLGLSKEYRMPELVADHAAMAAAIKENDAEKAVKFGMLHLARLDETIESISASNSNYFDD